MKIVLLEEVAGLGRTGEVKEVADGYGRNFLLPRRLALLATTAAIKEAQARQQAEALIQARSQAEMEALAKKLDGMVVTVKAKVGAEGRLYGSVTSGHLAEELGRLGQEMDKRKIELPEPIRQVGDYQVTIRLGGELLPRITVKVEAEG